jgi:hypothetical protein
MTKTGSLPTTPALEGASLVGARGGSHASQGFEPGGIHPTESAPTYSARRRRLAWSDLLKRVFGIDALRCPCGNSMRVLAAITEPAVARRILACMGLPARAPPLTPPSLPELAVGSWSEECQTADFDQTPPADWNSDA